MKKEIWKDIPGYEGLYQVSSFGKVKSLPKEWVTGYGCVKKHDGVMLKPGKTKQGYLIVSLYKNNKRKIFRVNVIVAMTFLGHKPDGHNVIVDHINEKEDDNRLDNLQLITARENSRRVQEGKGYTSNNKGVYWFASSKKWRSQIWIYKSKIHLGLFTNEERAAEVYQLALQNIHLFDGDLKKFRVLINSL